MKALATVTLVLTLCSLNATAGEGGKEADGLPGPGTASAIYLALDIAETYITPPGMLGVGTFEKSVGGLECTRSHVVYPNAPEHYSCKLSADERDDAAIYAALDVEEVNATPKGNRGVGILLKAAGNLKCYRRTPVVPHPVSHYQCVLK